MNKSKKNKNGYVVISTTLILLLVSVGIVATLARGNSQIVLSRIKSEQALAWSDACLEEGMLRIKNDPTYVGGEVNFPKGICDMNIVNENGVYTARVSFVGEEKYSRSVESQFEIVTGALNVISWEEKFFVIN